MSESISPSLRQTVDRSAVAARPTWSPWSGPPLLSSWLDPVLAALLGAGPRGRRVPLEGVLTASNPRWCCSYSVQKPICRSSSAGPPASRGTSRSSCRPANRAWLQKPRAEWEDASRTPISGGTQRSTQRRRSHVRTRAAVSQREHPPARYMTPGLRGIEGHDLTSNQPRVQRRQCRRAGLAVSRPAPRLDPGLGPPARAAVLPARVLPRLIAEWPNSRVGRARTATTRPTTCRRQAAIPLAAPSTPRCAAGLAPRSAGNRRPRPRPAAWSARTRPRAPRTRSTTCG